MDEANKRISLLAVLETLFATGFALYVAAAFSSFYHIAISASVAPLLLLRSPESVQLGLQLFTQLRPKRIDSGDFGGGDVKTLAYLILLSVSIRVIATLRHPIQGITSLPENWRRIVFFTDVRTPIEVIPGTGPLGLFLEDNYDITLRQNATHVGSGLASFVISALVARATSELGGWFDLVFVVSVLVSLSSFALVLVQSSAVVVHSILRAINFLYRISLKSTALVWLPLVYITPVKRP